MDDHVSFGPMEKREDDGEGPESTAKSARFKDNVVPTPMFAEPFSVGDVGGALVLSAHAQFLLSRQSGAKFVVVSASLQSRIPGSSSFGDIGHATVYLRARQRCDWRLLSSRAIRLMNHKQLRHLLLVWKHSVKRPWYNATTSSIVACRQNARRMKDTASLYGAYLYFMASLSSYFTVQLPYQFHLEVLQVGHHARLDDFVQKCDASGISDLLLFDCGMDWFVSMSTLARRWVGDGARD